MNEMAEKMKLVTGDDPKYIARDFMKILIPSLIQENNDPLYKKRLYTVCPCLYKEPCIYYEQDFSDIQYDRK